MTFFAVGVGVGLGLLVNSYIIPKLLASDTTQSWTFASSGDYTLSDSNLIEVLSNAAKLKVMEYSSDANTSLLLHLNESSGSATDSSSYSNSVTSNNITFVAGQLNNAATMSGTTTSIAVTDSTSISPTQSHSIEMWSKLSTNLSAGNRQEKQSLMDKGDYQLYFDNETGAITYELANNSATSWTQIAGNEVNNTWNNDGEIGLHSQVFIGSTAYVGLGNGTGDAEVWRWNGSAWTRIGGDAINSSWTGATYEMVESMATDGTDLYVGLGTTQADAEVWKYIVASNTWDKIGGDAINSSWAVNTFEEVRSLYYQSSTLYAGLANTANDAEVWSWNGSAWTKIGGDSLNSGWTTNFEYVQSLTGDGTNIYAGLGSTAGDAEVWRWNGSSWTRIGGDAINSSWANSVYEYVYSMTYVGGNLYAGLGLTAAEAEVWRWNGTAWTQIGGDGLNSSWATAGNYESVYSMANDGTNVYAGLGTSTGDQEVYRWNGTAWTKIGGDGVNSGFTGTNHNVIETLAYNGTTLYAGVTSAVAGKSSEYWSFNGTSWTQVGGNYVNQSWGGRGLQTIESMAVLGSNMYFAAGSSNAGNAIVYKYDGTNITVIGGQGVNSSWTKDTYEIVMDMTTYNGNLYVGLGLTAAEAEVWKWNGTTWSQVGGDGLNSSWATAGNYEEVYSLAAVGNYLYAGLGNSGNDAEVWRYDGSTWAKIGGDSTNSGWTTNYDRVTKLTSYQGNLYAGLGVTAGEAEVWKWSGTAWSKVGGDTVNSSWDSSNFEQVDSFATYNGLLVAGLGTGTGDADVWTYNGSTWTQIGGDDLNNGWTSGTYERVRALVVYNGQLYAGIGNGTNEGELWRWNGTTWSQVAGDSLNSSWTNIVEEVLSMVVYDGKLYAGIGNTQNADASVWSYGNNQVLRSSTVSHDTNWHHLAATYDGSTMKLYIDGVLDNSKSASVTMPDSTRALLIGNSYGARESGKSSGYFDGILDEVHLSSTARSSFNSTAYSADAQTVKPTTAVYTSQIKNYDQFAVSETLNGGTIEYRLSSDGGSTWKYYSGGWTTSSSTAQTSSASTINTNMSTFPVTSSGILWQAVLDGDGSQQVTLSSVTIGGILDNTAPTNPTSLTAQSTSGGSSLTTDTWYTHSAPYFSWTGADDGAGAGIQGYYVYFGTDNTAEPTTAGTLQAGTTFTASSLVSGSTYYLRIKTIDSAQNVSSSTWAPFTYKYDSTAPSNPPTITVSPAGYAATNSFTFSWSAGSDTASGLAGYQYKTATASGSLSDWSTATTSASITIENAAYQTDANTFYLRTTDTAGNTSSALQALYYFAGEGPSAPQNVAVNPLTNTDNSFAFSWQAPTTYLGSASDLTYCYTINTLPSENTCTFTSAGATSLSASSYATQTGLNIFYVSAKNSSDSGGAINYGVYSSVSFTANTTAPGIPLNVDLADVSVKSTSSWKLALSWEAPSDVGSGVDEYQIFRSTDDVTYTEVASTTGIAYVDTGLLQQTYYYKVRACDNTSNCGAKSEAVSLEPDGKYTTAPSLASGPTVSGITTKKATITWGTDRDADSKIQYGTSPGTYFTSEPSNSTQDTDHSISLSNLSPGTTYYYKARWTDEDGNTGSSSEKSFTTDPAPTVKDVSVVSSGLDNAILQFTVSGASSVKVFYGKTTTFGGAKTISTSTSETTYTAQLEDLEDGQKYYYKINLFDAEDDEYDGTILDFETLPRPKISSVRVQQVKNTAKPTVLVSWQTNTSTSSIITYYPANAPAEAKDEVNVTLVKGEHRLILRGLEPETPYTLIIKGRDKVGNEAASDPQKVTTATDTRPAVISNLKVEGGIQNNGESEQALAQLVVSWTTDEPTTAQVEYSEGTGISYSQKTQEDGNMTLNHMVVITGLTPSKVYHLRALSKDKAGNTTPSIDTVTITPKATDNALNLVINNLQQAFGFLGSL